MGERLRGPYKVQPAWLKFASSYEYGNKRPDCWHFEFDIDHDRAGSITDLVEV